jgi:hypothetical protein
MIQCIEYVLGYNLTVEGCRQWYKQYLVKTVAPVDSAPSKEVNMLDVFLLII